MKGIGVYLVFGIVSVVPCYFLVVFASSGYCTLKEVHARLVEAERALHMAPPELASAKHEDYQNARAAYNRRRRMFWGVVWGTICHLPPKIEETTM